MKKILLIFIIALGFLFPINSFANETLDPSSYKPVTDFLQDIRGGVSEKQPDFVNKRINDYTGELTIRLAFIYVADRVISLFSVLAIVLVVIAGLSIIVGGSDPSSVSKQGTNIAAILGSIFFMHTAKVVVDIFFQERGVGEPTVDIGETVERAKQGIVEPIIDLGLSFLSIVAIGFIIFNAFMTLANSSDDGKAGEYQGNVLYGMAGLIIVMLARPLVRVFYDFNFERESLGRPLEPNLELGVDLLFQLVNYALGILVFIAISVIIAAGYMMVVHFGDEGTVTKAKNMIKYVVVGFAIILSAYSLVAVLGVAPI